MSPAIQALVRLMDRVRDLFEATPPAPRECRYGNSSFQKFIDKLRAECASLHEELLSTDELKSALCEIKRYFLDSFGSYERLDYGTGHELNFICYLLCFLRLNIIGTLDDVRNLVLRVFK